VKPLLIFLLAFYLLFLGATTTRYLDLGPFAEDEWHAVTFGAEKTGDGLSWKFQDFGIIFGFCQQIWAQVTPRPYSVEGHEAIYAAWLKESPVLACPFAYAPSVLIVTAPFVLLPLPVVYWIFMLVSLALLICAYQRLSPTHDLLRSQKQALVLIGLSVSFLVNLGNGQTALWTTALIALTWSVIFDPKTAQWKSLDPRETWLAGLALFLVSPKPNLALTLGALLLAAGAWRAVFLASLAFALSFLAVSPLLGGPLVALQDYLQLLLHFNESSIGSYLREGLDAKTYTNLQSFCVQTGWVSAAHAARLNYALWLGGTAALLVFQFRRPTLSPRLMLLAILSVFLLFCPSVNATEDVLLALIVIESHLWKNPSGRWLRLALLFVVVNCNQNVGLFHGTGLAALPLPFLAKTVVLVWALAVEKMGRPPLPSDRC
jgi:hypothetical protein